MGVTMELPVLTLKWTVIVICGACLVYFRNAFMITFLVGMRRLSVLGRMLIRRRRARYCLIRACPALVMLLPKLPLLLCSPTHCTHMLHTPLRRISGAVATSILSKVLKTLLNHSRPTDASPDPGMPSSHAMNIAYLGTYLFLYVAWRGARRAMRTLQVVLSRI